MSLHERAATFRSPGHHRHVSGDRSEEIGRPSIARSSSGAMAVGSEGRELHERFPTARSAAGSSDQVSVPKPRAKLANFCPEFSLLLSCCKHLRGEGLQLWPHDASYSVRRVTQLCSCHKLGRSIL